MLPVALLLAALAYVNGADLAQHREFIAGQISKVAGRDLSLDGELDLNLASTTSLLVSDITLANAGWASDPAMLRIQRIEVEIEIIPLLRGDLRIPRFHVEGVEVSLETDASGKGNWVLQQPAAAAAEKDTAGAAGFRLPVLGDFYIGNVDLLYRDAVSGREINATLDHAKISNKKPAAPALVAIAGQLNAYPFHINGQLVLPTLLTVDSLDVPVELNASVLDFTAEVSGTISGSTQAPAVDLDLQLEADSLQQIRQVFGDVVPEVKPVRLAMQVQGNQEQPVSIKLETTAGEARLDAELNLRRDSPRPRLTGAVAISDIDVVRLWAPLFKAKPDKKAEQQSSVSSTAMPIQLDQPLDLAWLGILDTDLGLSAKQITLPQIHIKSLQAQLDIDDRLLNIDEVELITDAGTVNTALQLNARKRQAAAELRLKTSTVTLNKLPPLSQNPRLQHSQVEADVSLAAKGGTVVALIEGLKGSVQLVYDDQERKEKIRLRLARLPEQGATDINRFDVAATGNLYGQDIELKGHVIPPANLLKRGKPYEIDFSYQAFGITGEATGTTPALYQLDGLDLAVSAKADSLNELRKAFGEQIPDIGKIELSMRVQPGGSKLRIPALRIDLSEGYIDGWLVLDTTDPIPMLKTELDFVDLDLDELLARLDQTAKTKKTAAVKTRDDKVFPDEPLPFDALSRASISARLRAINVEHNNRRLKEAEVSFNITNGKFSASLDKMSSVKGDLNSNFVVDTGDKDAPVITIRLKAPKVEVGELVVVDNGSSAIEGPLAIDISLEGRGHSVAQIMATLTGNITLLMEQGSADAKALDLFVGGLGAMFGTFFSEGSSKTRIECAISDMKLEQGMLTTRLALLDTQYSTVAINGQVDLKQEQLDLKVSPEAKGVNLSVAFPVKVQGTLAKPNLTVEKTGALLKAGELWATVVYPPTALVKFSDLGNEKQNPCVTMVAEKAGRPILDGVNKALGGVVKGTEAAVKGFGGVFRDVGSDMDNLLGDDDGAPLSAGGSDASSGAGVEKSADEDVDDADLFMDY